VLHAKACRIGFKDSGEVRFGFDDKVSGPKPPKTPASDNQHWRHKLDQTDLLKRLRDIKELDGTGEIGPYIKAIKDKYASVRYWAVIGLHYSSRPADTDQAKAACEKALEDPAAVVRIAAAHALCDWGSEDKALPILAGTERQNKQSETIRDNRPEQNRRKSPATAVADKIQIERSGQLRPACRTNYDGNAGKQIVRDLFIRPLEGIEDGKTYIIWRDVDYFFCVFGISC
jgi:hypothetical protein